MTDHAHIPQIEALVRREEGQTMAEYGVVLAVITLGVVLALGVLGAAIVTNLDGVGSMIRDLAP